MAEPFRCFRPSGPGPENPGEPPPGSDSLTEGPKAEGAPPGNGPRDAGSLLGGGSPAHRAGSPGSGAAPQGYRDVLRGQSPGPSNTRALTPARGTILQCRIDALKVALKGGTVEAIRAQLRTRLEEARRLRTPVDFEVGAFRFALELRGAGGKEFRLRNADMTVLIGDDLHGFEVTVDFRAVFLATHTLSDVRDTVDRLATALLMLPSEVRVRRLDLCADATGIDFVPDDVDGFVTRARGRVRFGVYEKKKLTGFAIGQGGDISARVYDKVEELRLKCDDDHVKLQTELAAYRAAGWDERSTIWRLEFQLRGKALEQLQARDLDHLDDRLDPIWTYLVGEQGENKGAWLRLVDLATASRRERCELDGRWLAFQRVQFLRQAAPSARVTGRAGGVPGPSVQGAMLSFLAAHEDLPDLEGLSPRELLLECLARLAPRLAAFPGFQERFPEQVAAAAARFTEAACHHYDRVPHAASTGRGQDTEALMASGSSMRNRALAAR